MLSGIRIGIRSGIQSGLNPGGIATDGPAGAIYTPARAADWAALSLTTPNSIWPCSEASGNLVDSVAGVVGVPNGAVSYQNTVTNWTRKFVGFSEAATGQRFGIPNSTYSPATASQANLVYARIDTVSGTNRGISSLGANLQLRFSSAGLLQIVNGGAVTTGAYDYRDSAVHPFLVIHNRTATTTTVFTDKETLSVAYTSGTDSANKGLGCVAATTAPVSYVGYWAHWSGASAEAVGKPTVEGLGWTMAY
jgi:hypothetical protein